MATQQFNQVTYGLTQPLYPEFQQPIVSHRNPTTADKAQFGTVWLNQTTNGFFVLTSIVANQAMWATGSGGTGISTLTGDTGGPISPLMGNIDILGTAGEIIVTGTANTLTLSLDGEVIPTSYECDTGSADASGGVLQVVGGLSLGGGPNIKTEGSGNIIEIILTDSVYFPNTNDTGTEGVIYLNAARFIHNFGLNTFYGTNAGNLTLDPNTANLNTGLGEVTLNSLTTGAQNTAVGSGTLFSITTGNSNTAVGHAVLNNIETGSENTAMGDGALSGLDAGASRNTAVGFEVAEDLDTGNDNILIGHSAGSALQTSESSNIIIGNAAVIGDNHTIRIGTAGGGAAQQNKCFIAGIFGITVGGSGIPVNVDNAGQLGTVVSSERFKENIITLNNESDLLHKLRPVKFNYKSEKSVTNFGFIAEEVAEVLPELMVFDVDNEPMTIRYMDIIALLVKEVQLLKKEINNLNNKIN